MTENGIQMTDISEFVRGNENAWGRGVVHWQRARLLESWDAWRLASIGEPRQWLNGIPVIKLLVPARFR